MKIILLSYFDEASKGGGESRVTFELAQQLEKFNNEVVIICPSSKTGEFIGKDGIKCFGLKSLGSHSSPFTNLTTKNIKELNDFLSIFSPDILHAHTISYIGFLGQIWAIKNNKPFVYTAHEIPTKTSEFLAGASNMRKFFTDHLVHLFVKDFFSHCDSIIALTKASRHDIESVEYEGNVYIVPNGRDFEVYSNLAINHDKYESRNLVFTGHICDRKNQKYLVEAMKFIPEEFNLVLVGEFIEPIYYEKLKKIIEVNNLENRIKLVGQVDHKSIAPILEKAFAFVSATKMEAFSLSILEALVSGTPLVMLDELNTSEWVSKPETRIVPRKSAPEVFANEVIKLSKLSEAEYVNLCNETRKKVQHYSWNNVVQETMFVYRETIKNYKKSKDSSKKVVDYINSIRNLEITNNVDNIIKSAENTIGAKKNLIIFTLVTFSVIGYSVLNLRNMVKNAKK